MFFICSVADSQWDQYKTLMAFIIFWHNFVSLDVSTCCYGDWAISWFREELAGLSLLRLRLRDLFPVCFPGSNAQSRRCHLWLTLLWYRAIHWRRGNLCLIKWNMMTSHISWESWIISSIICFSNPGFFPRWFSEFWTQHSRLMIPTVPESRVSLLPPISGL